MTNTIPNVPRELLCELRDAANESMNATTRQHQIDHFAGLIAKADALLSAPSPAGVDGLEVVGTLRYFMDYPDSPHSAPGYITHQFNPASWDHAGEAAGEHKLCRLSDAQAIIDGLRGENERIRLNIAEYNEAIACYQSERDQQAQRIGELEGLLREAYKYPLNHACETVDFTAQDLCERIAAALSAGKEGE